MAYEHELEVARAAAREAAAILLRHYQGGTISWQKAEDDHVTLADLEADRAIARQLREAFPDDAIVSEESASHAARASGERAWIVDPMDGTKEFRRKIPEFGVSIALVEAGRPVAGVIHNPAAGVSVWARSGGGTWRNGQRVRVSSCTRLEEAVLIASRTETSRGLLAPYEGWFRQIRPVGSIAWKLACIASGVGDLHVSFAPKSEWDVCAGDLLVREAGGRYTDRSGAPRIYDRQQTQVGAGMAAGPAPLVEAFFEREARRGWS